MRNCQKYILIIFFLQSAIPMLYAQDSDKDRLRKEKEKLQQEINYTNELLKKAKKNTQSSLSQLVILNQKIEKRKKLIKNIEKDINATENLINQRKSDIAKLNRTLSELKKEYARMINAAYKNRNSHSRLMFILSANDFNQAYIRFKYIQQFNKNLIKKAELINNTQISINIKISELNNNKNEKEILKKNNLTENKQLQDEKKQKGKTLKNLQSKQKQLQNTLKEKQKAASKLQRQIEAIIAKEISESSSKKDVVKNKNPMKFSLTREEQLLSNTFSGNKGRLPWPTVKGIISNSFGEHEHPVLKGIKTKNNGIDIATEAGAEARAVYDGKITAVISIPGGEKAVIIRHGDYLTVYSNLSQTYVSKGDKVTAKQKIGKISTDSEDSKTELHFELWQGKTLLNPQSWLAN